MTRLYDIGADEFVTDRNRIIDILVKGTSRLMTFVESRPYRGDPSLTPTQRFLLLGALRGTMTWEDNALRTLHQMVRERWRALREPLTLAYVIAEGRYYLVAGDRTEAVPLPHILHSSLTEIQKPKAERHREASYGRDLVSWPPRGESRVVPVP